MWHALFIRFKNADGNWQWKCKKVWNHKLNFMYLKPIPYYKARAHVGINVHRRPPIGFCRKPHFYGIAKS